MRRLGLGTLAVIVLAGCNAQPSVPASPAADVCGATLAPTVADFTIAHAADIGAYVSAMASLPPELRVDSPARVVVFAGGWRDGPGRSLQSPEPGRRFVCIQIGPERDVYSVPLDSTY